MRLRAMAIDGLTTFEILLSLTILAVVVPPCLRWAETAAADFRRATKRSAADAALLAAIARLGRDVRCACAATEAEDAFVGRAIDGFSDLAFTTAAGDGALVQRRVRYGTRTEGDRTDLIRIDDGDVSVLAADIRRFDLHFFNGETWSAAWGWDDAAKRPSIGIRGLPLAVEIRLATEDDRGIREAIERVPVMTPVLNRTLHG